MKVKLFWTEDVRDNYKDKDHGTLYPERYLLTHTEPDLDDIQLEELEYIEAPIIERLPKKTLFFSFNKLDVERIIHRRWQRSPGENVLGIILEDLSLILNRGHLKKFNEPLPEIEFILCTSYRYTPRIVQLLCAIHTIAEEWPEEDVTRMQNAFKRDKERLMEMWPQLPPRSELN